jgi:hypothetical protein
MQSSDILVWRMVTHGVGANPTVQYHPIWECGGKAYATDLKSVAERIEGSTPSTPTISNKEVDKQ